MLALQPAHAAAACLSLAVALPLGSQEPITLQQAIALAQERGFQAQAARAARDAARYRSDAFTARLLPQLSLSGTVPAYNRLVVPVVLPSGNTAFRPQDQTNPALTLLLSQKLPVTGGDFLVTSSLSRLEVLGPQSIVTWFSTPISIGLQQNILRPNVAGWDRREQNVRTELAERTYREALEDIALATTDFFFDMYGARVALDNAVANAAVNDTLYSLNNGRFTLGKIGENDLLQSELALLRARAALERSRLDDERATAALRLALHLPPGAPLAIAVSTGVPEFEADTARAVTEALRNRALVSDVELREVQARRRVTEAKLTNGFGATVQATYGLNATAPTADLAYQNLLNARQFTVSVQMPLWQWGAHTSDIQAAEADREGVASQSRALIERAVHEAHFAALDLALARRNVAVLAKADTVGQKRFAVAYNRYLIGRIAMDNLYIAQTEKDQALTNFVQGLRSYWEAHYRLRRATLFDFATGQTIR
jgi:outer membrane protein TolC